MKALTYLKQVKEALLHRVVIQSWQRNGSSNLVPWSSDLGTGVRQGFDSWPYLTICWAIDIDVFGHKLALRIGIEPHLERASPFNRSWTTLGYDQSCFIAHMLNCIAYCDTYLLTNMHRLWITEEVFRHWARSSSGNRGALAASKTSRLPGKFKW